MGPYDTDASLAGKDAMVVISKTWWGIKGYDLWNQMSGGLPLR